MDFSASHGMQTAPSEAPKSNLSPAALEVAPVLQETTEVYREIKNSNGESIIQRVNKLIDLQMKGESDPLLVAELDIDLKLAEKEVLDKFKEKYVDDPETLDKKTIIAENYFDKLRDKNINPSSDSMAS